MFTHAEVWRGIDRLARKHGLSPSGLAKSAGLDATTFNPSKRITKENKSRWPSTESIAKILDATGSTLADFVTLMRDDMPGPTPAAGRRLPCLTTDQLEGGHAFDEAGFPKGEGWQEVDPPTIEDNQAYALEVVGGRLAPFYDDGDILILSPTASVRRMDKVVLMERSGETRIGQLSRRTAQRVEIRDFARQGETSTVATRDVAWLVRIAWASQ